MSLSDSSALSSPPSSDEEPELPRPVLKLKHGKLTAAARRRITHSPEPSPPPPDRESSPPHEYVLADNPDIAFIVMFRSRFADAFPKNTPNLGPQDIERGIVGTDPDEQVENLLCALLGLVLNRKKFVERGHHGRAVEEAIHTNKSQWPLSWNGVNPLHGNGSFQTMNPTERLNLLKTLVLWSLSTSEIIMNMIKDSFKQTRQDDDKNQPLSVQPWGSDSRKRRYWLIEGQNDTPFRIYRESNPKLKTNTWWSVAGTIEDLTNLAEALRADSAQGTRRLGESMLSAVPRLESVEEKRKRKEYRQTRKAQFTRPEPGFSLYEGRTRGKRMKYTFSDEEDEGDETSTRRSNRQSERNTPAHDTITASGRHVRSRFGRSYGGELNNGGESSEVNGDESDVSRRRSSRSAVVNKSRHFGDASGFEEGSEDDAEPSGEEWNGDDEDVTGKFDDDDDEDDELSDAGSTDSLLDRTPSSLIVHLKYRSSPSGQAKLENGSLKPEPHDITTTVQLHPLETDDKSTLDTKPGGDENVNQDPIGATPQVQPPTNPTGTTNGTQEQSTAKERYPAPTPTTLSDADTKTALSDKHGDLDEQPVNPLPPPPPAPRDLAGKMSVPSTISVSASGYPQTDFDNTAKQTLKPEHSVPTPTPAAIATPATTNGWR